MDELSRVETERLWKVHDDIIMGRVQPSLYKSGVSLFDIKVELARREIQNCKLCGWQCGVNRFESSGRCGLKKEARYDSLFIHVAEEAVFTPCAVVKLQGCALRCAFCQANESFNPDKGEILDEGIWDKLKNNSFFEKAVAIEFVGGNPDESVYAILQCLRFAPDSLNLPVVWNNNGYASEVLYKLLDGVVDVWLTDFKYGNDECALRLSGIKDYWAFARSGVERITGQKAKAIIRILVLPSHEECCHRKALEFLSNYSDKVWISINENYVPEWRAINAPDIGKLVSAKEIARVKELVKYYGLRNVAEEPEGFWRED